MERYYIKSRHALYPVCEESSDKIIGLLNADDYFRLDDKSRKNIMTNAVKEPYYVPEGVKADVLFRNMREKHHKLAVVLDEYGGFSGVITLNDLIEQLVGDLGEDEDSNENSEKYIQKIDSNTWKINGRAEIDDVEKELGVSITNEEHETFNGYVFSVLGTVSQDGTNVEVKTEKLLIKVTEIKEHQINVSMVSFIE